jgi:D-psicose/D-tagatose/L-ribulose 3-epimerase
MQIGVHLFTFVPRIDSAVPEILPRLRDLGYDGCEIPLLDGRLDLVDAPKIGRRLDTLGMFCIAGSGIPERLSTVSEDPAVRKAGISFLERCVDITAELGADFLTGALYAPFGAAAAAAGRTRERRLRSIDSLREVCAHAAGRGVALGLEPLNRYEHYFLNGAAETTEFVREVGAPNLKVHLDTFHMNIEERSFHGAVVAAGSLLAHVHAAENDRSIPGTGLADWDGLFRGLAEIGYRGRIVMETFFEAIPDIADFSRVWRRLSPDPDTFSRQGIAFLRAKAAQYGLA